MGKATIVWRQTQDDHYATVIHKNSFDHEYSRDSVIVTLSIALALYNSLEMALLICSTFKRWKGLYFWSLSICNTGVVLYTLGMLLTYFALGPLLLGKIILDIGWASMIVFQSLVLYSRLNLIVDNLKIIQATKWMIVVNSITICSIVIIFDFGFVYSNLSAFDKGYYYIEQIQLTLFTIQELIISGIYVWKTLAMLKVISKENTRSMIFQLFVINVIIISMDIAIVLLQYLHFQLYQESIKGFVYSVKLKLEVNILSKLVNVIHGNATSRSMTLEVIDSNAIAGQVQAEVKNEMSSTHPLGHSIDYGSPERHEAREKDSETGPLESGSSSQRDDAPEITRITSRKSTYGSRTNGRDIDIMYADMMRSITREDA